MEQPYIENVQESLAAIEDTMLRTRKAVGASRGSPYLILWGLLMTTAYAFSHFYPKYSHLAFIMMAVIGNAGAILIHWKFERKMPFKEPVALKTNLRIWALWGALFLYVVIWLNLFAPSTGIQINAFIVTAVMFGMIILGLWFTAYFMVWLGLFITAVTLIGVFLLPHYYYCPWMAVMCGGVMFCTGLFIKLRWR
jgi:hypothetical protein